MRGEIRSSERLESILCVRAYEASFVLTTQHNADQGGES